MLTVKPQIINMVSICIQYYTQLKRWYQQFNTRLYSRFTQLRLLNIKRKMNFYCLDETVHSPASSVSQMSVGSDPSPAPSPSCPSPSCGSISAHPSGPFCPLQPLLPSSFFCYHSPPTDPLVVLGRAVLS